jgi:hypothetical protein
MNADDLPIEDSGPPPAANPLRPVAEVMSALGTVWIGALMLLVLLGVHIAVSLISVAFAGIWYIRGDPELAMRLL